MDGSIDYRYLAINTTRSRHLLITDIIKTKWANPAQVKSSYVFFKTIPIWIFWGQYFSALE